MRSAAASKACASPPGNAAGALAQGARADQVQGHCHALALGLDRIQAPQVHLPAGKWRTA